jgi:hypothetical protein
MRDSQPASRHASVETRRAERELFFWTANQGLKLVAQILKIVLLAALSAYFVVSLIEGHVPIELLFRQLA